MLDLFRHLSHSIEFNGQWGKTRNLAAAVKTLETAGIAPETLQRFSDFLQTAPSRELYHANPRRIARQLQLPEQQTLRLLVFALKEGIVTLNWDIICEACSSIDTGKKNLGDLHSHYTCPYCRACGETDVDTSVRVTFSIDERFRRLDSKADDREFRAKIDAEYGVVSAHRLLTLQIFRTLFPRETIPPNESLRVRQVAILFTDLAGSTALYSRLGDSQAYSLVRHHFQHLFEVVDNHQGVVVKTIGDAIMAAFTEPAHALAAAVNMHENLNKLNQQMQLPAEDRLILKIGIDAGPCISVNLNGQPDYFGTTVNTAARVQATSKGNDIAITDNVLKYYNLGNFYPDFSADTSELNLKGIENPVRVHYLGLGSILEKTSSEINP